MTTRRSTSIDAFGLAQQSLGVWPMPFEGNIIRAERVFYHRPPALPAYLRGVFAALRDAKTPVQLVTVRKSGVQEQADGKHLHHYLIPAEQDVQVVGMTI